MKIYLSPQITFDTDYILYVFEGDKITATYNGESDLFDFTAMPNGIANAITSNLAINPIISAKRINNVLYVELMNLIPEYATEKEMFPDWVDADEYVAPTQAIYKPLQEELQSDELEHSELPIVLETSLNELETHVVDTEGGGAVG